MTIVAVSATLAARIQAQAYTRNNQVAPNRAAKDVAAALNQCANLCGKELFTAGGNVVAIAASGAGTVVRHRGRFRTGPFCDKVRVYLALARPDSGDPATNNPSVTFELQNTSGSVLASFVAYWGYGTNTGDPNSWGSFSKDLDVSTDTEYIVVVKTSACGRVADVLVHELALSPDTTNGYVPNPSNSILDNTRAAAQLAAYNLYRRAGAVVLNWSGARSNATTTDTNIIDGTTTGTPSASSPGFMLDMQYKARRRDATTGVNCLLYAYGSVASGTGGSVRVKNSAGTTLAFVTFTATAGWQVATLVLPATLAKYDLTLAGSASSTLSITDVAIIEYET